MRNIVNKRDIMGRSLFSRANFKLRVLLQGRVRCYGLAASLVEGKRGIEVGGPSQAFGSNRSWLPIYRHVGSLDNCDFSSTTTWARHSEEFVFHPGKAPGKAIFADGSSLSLVPDHSYDFVLSSHNLEHFANPVKALKEWQRIAVKGGPLIVVLPNYRYTFDHLRQPTAVSHMLADFEQDTPETDLTHLSEILEKHDLSVDKAAGTPEEFRARSLANYENRCLHHHVFDQDNSRKLLSALGMEVLAVETALPFHIFIIARML
jgi:SAM-dependent methyltransferase